MDMDVCVCVFIHTSTPCSWPCRPGLQPRKSLHKTNTHTHMFLHTSTHTHSHTQAHAHAHTHRADIFVTRGRMVVVPAGCAWRGQGCGHLNPSVCRKTNTCTFQRLCAPLVCPRTCAHTRTHMHIPPCSRAHMPSERATCCLCLGGAPPAWSQRIAKGRKHHMSHRRKIKA